MQNEVIMLSNAENPSLLHMCVMIRDNIVAEKPVHIWHSNRFSHDSIWGSPIIYLYNPKLHVTGTISELLDDVNNDPIN